MGSQVVLLGLWGGVLHFFLLSLEWGCGGRVAETFADPFCDNFGEIVAADWK